MYSAALRMLSSVFLFIIDLLKLKQADVCDIESFVVEKFINSKIILLIVCNEFDPRIYVHCFHFKSLWFGCRPLSRNLFSI